MYDKLLKPRQSFRITLYLSKTVEKAKKMHFRPGIFKCDFPPKQARMVPILPRRLIDDAAGSNNDGGGDT